MSEAEKVVEEIIEEVAAEDSPLESIAREGGWSPESEWRGDSEKWKDAETFIKDGITIQGKQHDKIDRLQNTVEKVETSLKTMADGEAKRMKTALESQKTRLETERQEAFELQDSDKFNQVDQELNETNQQLQELSPVDKEYIDGEQAFAERNEWFRKDRGMTADIMSVAQTLRPMYGENESNEYYEALEETVKARYPDKFRNTNRDKGSVVSGDKPGGTRKKGGFDSLPPEAKAAYENIKLELPSYTKEQYAKAHFEQE